jgi:hypothetical protein
MNVKYLKLNEWNDICKLKTNIGKYTENKSIYKWIIANKPVCTENEIPINLLNAKFTAGIDINICRAEFLITQPVAFIRCLGFVSLQFCGPFYTCLPEPQNTREQ